ncbi:MAG: hypothetical protein Q9166_003474 [cf. Caloplaca sp. 2 TL-2023]
MSPTTWNVVATSLISRSLALMIEQLSGIYNVSVPYRWGEMLGQSSLTIIYKSQAFRNPDIHESSVANAGGYCHTGIDPSTSELTRIVWFSDEFTPRHEWTWSGNFLASIAIRTYCWRRCACNIRPTKANVTTSIFGLSVWPLLGDIYVAEHPNGSMTLGNLNTQTSQMQILPAQPPVNRLGGTAPAAGTCGIDGKQFCEIPWPVEILGPDIPRAPSNVTQVVKPPPRPPSDNLTECGRYCSKPQDCSPAVDDGNGCFCGIPSPEDSRILSLDPVAPVPVCLVLAHLLGGGLSGRDIDTTQTRYLDQSGEPYLWPCNSFE